MASDRARLSFDPGRRYRELLGLQGRVLLEADLNEGQRIFSEEMRLHARDFVGPCGTPDDGYRITAPTADFEISAGTMYVAGLRNVLPARIRYSAQPDWLDTALPQPWSDDLWRPVSSVSGSNSHVMLLLREQEITAVEDPALREVALGGPDSAARTRILQRVVAAPTTSSSCPGAMEGMGAFWSARGLIYDPKSATLSPRARLRVGLIQAAAPPSPCDPPAASGYLGADNQLIRVQLVQFDAATRRGKLLWAYHNGSVLYRARALDATTLELATRPVSAEFEPRSGNVVQLLLPAAELAAPVAGTFPGGAYAAAPTGHRATLTAPYAAETRRITLPAALPAVFPLSTAVPPLFVRLWEGEVDFELNSPVALPGTGLQVTISAATAGNLHVGDHWSFAVRPLTPNAVYPERYLAAPQPPDGLRMWACSLAVIQPTPGGGFQVADCRVPFDPLTTPPPPAGEGESCCCVKVTPREADRLQEIIDEAVNTNAGVGVTIQLEPGEYHLRQPLRLTDKHRGTVIEACSGARPVLIGNESPEFSMGLILAAKCRDVVIRSLEFRPQQVRFLDDHADMMHVAAKSDVPDFGAPQLTAIGIRGVQCLSLTVEDCDFRLPANDAVFGFGILIQGDNGKIEIDGCRFDGSSSDSIGICLAPVLINADAVLQVSSAEVLVVRQSVFSRGRVGILLSSRPLLTFIEENVTRYVFCSLVVLWYDSNFKRIRDVFRQFDPDSHPPEHQTVVSRYRADSFLMRMVAHSLLLPLGEFGGLIAKREFIHTLLDIRSDEAAQTSQEAPVALRLNVAGNHFDSRHPNSRTGPDTLIWDLNSREAMAALTGNTIWGRAELAAVGVLGCDGFNITGNVIGNEFERQDRRFPRGLLVLPASRMVGEAMVNLFTVTGNTIFGGTNLREFPRQEWEQQLGEGFKGILTWEFFNTIV